MLNLNLSTEQQFKLRTYQIQIEKLSEEQAKGLLEDLIKQIMIKDNVISQLMKQGGI